jgi:hypothetical protein
MKRLSAVSPWLLAISLAAAGLAAAGLVWPGSEREPLASALSAELQRPGETDSRFEYRISLISVEVNE